MNPLLLVLVPLQPVALVADSLAHDLAPWAAAANTALLIVLAVLTSRNSANSREAANNSGEAARVAKDVGAAIRHVDPLVVYPGERPGSPADRAP